jgi:hypothetical protein
MLGKITRAYAKETMSKEAFIEALREGRESSISKISGLGAIFQPTLDELADALRQSSQLQSIDLPNTIMGRVDFGRFGEALRQQQQLQTINLQQTIITPESAQALADGIRHNTALRSVNLGRCELDTDSANVLLDALATCPNLREVTLSDNALGTKGAEAVGQMMRNTPWLQTLKLRNCEFSPDDLRAIADAMPFCRRLVELDCGLNASEEGAEILLAALDKGANPNLITYFPTNKVSDEHRKRHRENALELTQALAACHQDFAALPASQMGEIYDMLPGINQTNGKLVIIAPFEDYVDSLPRVDDRDTIHLADLTTQGKDGHCALSNPRTWQRLPKVLEALEASGEQLTLELLLQPNRDGESHLATALTTAPDVVIPALNAHGVQLTDEVLLENGKPSAILETLIRRRAGSDLFTHENWQGRSSEGMRAVYNHLPEPQKERVQGMYTLAATLRSESAQGKGVGR